MDIYSVVKNYLEQRGCELVEMSNVSGMGESYIVKFITNSTDCTKIKEDIITLIQKEWKNDIHKK